MKKLSHYIQEALEGSQMKYSGKNCEFVDVILEDPDGKILILRRANYMKNFRTCWGVIGGAVDISDKTPKDAAVRETAEETGISLSFNEVNNMKQLFDYKYKDGNISHVFHTRLETKIDKVKISREHSKYEWINFYEEKIDERKWIPEVFNILQKWETTRIDERLIINKDFCNTIKVYNDGNFLDVIDERFKKAISNKTYKLDYSDLDTSDITSMTNLFNAVVVDDADKITEINIEGWNTKKVLSFQNMFRGCENLERIIGIEDIDVSNATSFVSMFENCKKLKCDLNTWKVKNTSVKGDMFTNVPMNSIPNWYVG